MSNLRCFTNSYRGLKILKATTTPKKENSLRLWPFKCRATLDTILAIEPRQTLKPSDRTHRGPPPSYLAHAPDFSHEVHQITGQRFMSGLMQAVLGRVVLHAKKGDLRIPAEGHNLDRCWTIALPRLPESV